MGTKFQQSSLLIGKSGVGKTTVLREITQLLSEDTYLNCLIVVVVDKLRTSRRMLSLLTTYRPPQDADAARQRGVMLIATVHGQSIVDIVNCKERGCCHCYYGRGTLGVPCRVCPLQYFQPR